MSERYVVLTIEPGKPLRLPRLRRARWAGRRAAAAVSIVALIAATVATVAMVRSAGQGIPSDPPPGFDLTAPSQAAEPGARADAADEPATAGESGAVPLEGDDVEPAETTEPPQPLPAVPVVPGSLADLPDEEGMPVPVRVVVDALDIDAPVEPVGIEDGEMEIPRSADDVAWYQYGPVPGEPGSAVLAAHVAWGGRPGVFEELRDLPPGARIDVFFGDGTVRSFEAVVLTSYAKTELPTDLIFAREGVPVLTLITCGGAFNPSLRSYEDNVVAYAVPIETGPDRTSPRPGIR